MIEATLFGFWQTICEIVPVILNLFIFNTTIMKAKLFSLLLLGMLFIQWTPAGNVPTHETETAIVFFQGTYAEALEAAKTQNKKVFIDAYASWCGPCKMLTRQVFTDPAVGAVFNEHFVNVKIDMEKGEGPGLARKFGVTAYPTLLFLDADGAIIKKAIGYHNSEQLITVGNSVANTKAAQVGG